MLRSHLPFGSVASPKQPPASELGRAFCKYMDRCADANDGYAICTETAMRILCCNLPKICRLLLQPAVTTNVPWSKNNEYILPHGEDSYVRFADTGFINMIRLCVYLVWKKAAPLPNMTDLPPAI